MAQRKRRFGDRKDGWRLRHTHSFFSVMPHFMKRRSDAQVFFDDVIEIEELEKYVREMRRKNDMPWFSLYHVFIAAALRMFVQRPYLNRFVMNGKVFARNRLNASMTVKRELSASAPDACIKPTFEPTDTVFDVNRRVNEAMDAEVRDKDGANDTDVAANLLNKLPAWVVRAFINFITFMDHRGWMNKFINNLSPFHTSFYITDVGSIGIGPVYHHIYDFGTTSIFLALGKKERITVVGADGTVSVKKVVRVRIVVDERICDGQYFAESFRMFRRLLKKPELLEVPPTEFPEDDWI